MNILRWVMRLCLSSSLLTSCRNKEATPEHGPADIAEKSAQASSDDLINDIDDIVDVSAVFTMEPESNAASESLKLTVGSEIRLIFRNTMGQEINTPVSLNPLRRNGDELLEMVFVKPKVAVPRQKIVAKKLQADAPGELVGNDFSRQAHIQYWQEGGEVPDGFVKFKSVRDGISWELLVQRQAGGEFGPVQSLKNTKTGKIHFFVVEPNELVFVKKSGRFPKFRRAKLKKTSLTKGYLTPANDVLDQISGFSQNLEDQVMQFFTRISDANFAKVFSDLEHRLDLAKAAQPPGVPLPQADVNEIINTTLKQAIRPITRDISYQEVYISSILVHAYKEKLTLPEATIRQVHDALRARGKEMQSEKFDLGGTHQPATRYVEEFESIDDAYVGHFRKGNKKFDRKEAAKLYTQLDGRPLNSLYFYQADYLKHIADSTSGAFAFEAKGSRILIKKDGEEIGFAAYVSDLEHSPMVLDLKLEKLTPFDKKIFRIDLQDAKRADRALEGQIKAKPWIDKTMPDSVNFGEEGRVLAYHLPPELHDVPVLGVIPTGLDEVGLGTRPMYLEFGKLTE